MGLDIRMDSLKLMTKADQLDGASLGLGRIEVSRGGDDTRLVLPVPSVNPG